MAVAVESVGFLRLRERVGSPHYESKVEERPAGSLVLDLRLLIFLVMLAFEFGGSSFVIIQLQIVLELAILLVSLLYYLAQIQMELRLFFERGDGDRQLLGLLLLLHLLDFLHDFFGHHFGVIRHDSPVLLGSLGDL